MRKSRLPPSWMSVPRPAMLVAMVTAPMRPGLGDDMRFLLVEAGVQHRVLDAFLARGYSDSISDFSIDTVPTSTGWPISCCSLISLAMAANLSVMFL